MSKPTETPPGEAEIVTFPAPDHRRSRRLEPGTERHEGRAGNVVDFDADRTMQFLCDEMELGLLLQMSFDPADVNEIIRARRCRAQPDLDAAQTRLLKQLLARTRKKPAD